MRHISSRSLGEVGLAGHRSTITYRAPWHWRYAIQLRHNWVDTPRLITQGPRPTVELSFSGEYLLGLTWRINLGNLGLPRVPPQLA